MIVSPTDPNDFVDASPLSRAAYVRARDAGAPMLCHALPDARRTCLIHDRATGAVTVIYSTAL